MGGDVGRAGGQYRAINDVAVCIFFCPVAGGMHYVDGN